MIPDILDACDTGETGVQMNGRRRFGDSGARICFR